MPSRAKRTNPKTGKVAPVKPRKKVKCLVCKQPMLVAPGQVAKYHGVCRDSRVY